MTTFETIGMLLWMGCTMWLQATAAPVNTANAGFFTGAANHSADSTEPATFNKSAFYYSGDVLDNGFLLNRRSSTAFKSSLGRSRKGFAIETYYFPGKCGKRALVIGGMHGSELSSIEIAKTLIRQLQQNNTSEYDVLIIPCLFPDNALAALSDPQNIGSVHNIGRYTFNSGVDPNRQMPSLGKPFIAHQTKDHLEREIEYENRLLLQLISKFRPDRIINIHAIRNLSNAGIYADPRTDSKGRALGFETDSLLAINMAKHVEANGGSTPGNRLNRVPTARYPKDPAIVPPYQYQPRSVCGSALVANKGCGVSLGSWASTAVEDGADPTNNRDAITLITMEFPGYKRSVDYVTEKERRACRKQVLLFTSAIQKIFLEKDYSR